MNIFKHVLFVIAIFSLFINVGLAKDPCEVIDQGIINSVFDPKGNDLTIKSSENTYPSCRYTWKGDNIKTSTIGGKKMTSQIESTVNVVIVQENVNVHSFEASLKSYTNGYEKVNLGEHAVWSNERKQLTVYIDQRLFHIHVDVSPDVAYNKDKALELAEILISRF